MVPLYPAYAAHARFAVEELGAAHWAGVVLAVSEPCYQALVPKNVPTGGDDGVVGESGGGVRLGADGAFFAGGK